MPAGLVRLAQTVVRLAGGTDRSFEAVDLVSEVATRRLRQAAADLADDRHVFRQLRSHVARALESGAKPSSGAAPESICRGDRLSAELVRRAVESRVPEPVLPGATALATELYREYVRTGVVAPEHADELVTEVDVDAELDGEALAVEVARTLRTDRHRALALHLGGAGFVDIARDLGRATATAFARCADGKAEFAAVARARGAGHDATRVAICRVAAAA